MDHKLIEFILGIELERIHEKVIIAPCWLPESVGLKCEVVSSGACKIWDCYLNDSVFTYIVSGVGAAGCLDIVTALGETKCKEIMFIGSAGALVKGINIGDIAMPDSIVCAEGASRFVNERLIEDSYGKKYSVDKDLYKKMWNSIQDIDLPNQVALHTGKGISVESIILQYEHIAELVEFESCFVDMESSAFLAGLYNTKMKGILVYCISDNVAQGEPLYLIQEDKILSRKNVRKIVFSEIIKFFLEGDIYDV